MLNANVCTFACCQCVRLENEELWYRLSSHWATVTAILWVWVCKRRCSIVFHFLTLRRLNGRGSSGTKKSMIVPYILCKCWKPNIVFFVYCFFVSLSVAHAHSNRRVHLSHLTINCYKFIKMNYSCKNGVSYIIIGLIRLLIRFRITKWANVFSPLQTHSGITQCGDFSEWTAAIDSTKYRDWCYLVISPRQGIHNQSNECLRVQHDHNVFFMFEFFINHKYFVYKVMLWNVWAYRRLTASNLPHEKYRLVLWGWIWIFVISVLGNSISVYAELLLCGKLYTGRECEWASPFGSSDCSDRYGEEKKIQPQLERSYKRSIFSSSAEAISSVPTTATLMPAIENY